MANLTLTIPGHSFCVGDIVYADDFQWLVNGEFDNDFLNEDIYRVAEVNGDDICIVEAVETNRMFWFHTPSQANDFNPVMGVIEWNNTNWVPAGTDFETGGSLNSNGDIAALSETRIAQWDSFNDELRMFDFDPDTGAFSQTGNGLSLPGPAFVTLARLTPNRVALAESGPDFGISVYEFDGTNWSLIGAKLSLSGFESAMTALSPIRVAVFNESFGFRQLRTLQFGASEGIFDIANKATESFGDGVSQGQNIGLQFANTDAGDVTGVRIEVHAVATAFNAVVKIYTDVGGTPGVQVGGDSDAVALNSAGEKFFSWSTNVPALSAATTYWVIVSDATADGSGSVTLKTVADQGAGFKSGKNDTIASIDDGSGAFSTADDWKIDVAVGGWAQIGNALTINTAGVDIAALFPDRIALVFAGGGSGELRTYEFDETDWAQVGSSLNISEASAGLIGGPGLAALSAARVGLFDTTNEAGNPDEDRRYRTYEFDCSTGTWAQVGNTTQITADDSRKMTQATSFFDIDPQIDTTGVEYLEGGTVSDTTDSVDGNDHLEGEDVVIVADGEVFEDTVEDGVVSGWGFAAGRVHVGLAYTADIETLNITDQSGDASQHKKKSVSRVLTRFFKSLDNILIGPNENNLTPMLKNTLGADDKAVLIGDGENEDREIHILPEWNSNGRLFIRQADPSPLTILAVAPRFEEEDEDVGQF